MTQENPIVTENRLQGTADWIISNPASTREIEGYASQTSVKTGDDIELFIHTHANSFSLEVYRMGWYQSLGARSVFGPVELPGTKQMMPIMDAVTGLVDCDWCNPFTLSTANTRGSETWLSGIYLVKLTESNQGKQSYIIFVVHDNSRTADILVQQSVTTYQAYNNWGGKSLYKWNSTYNKRACKLSYNRPYAMNEQNTAAQYGIGAGEFLCNVQPHHSDYPVSNAGWEYNMVRWLEREGYDVAYCTNINVHTHPAMLLNYRAWLSVGHDEYWTQAMRNHLQQALVKGLNLGFFSANSGYWQIRLEASSKTKAENRVMVCHKSASRDPYAKINKYAHLTSCKWRDNPVARPESQLLGIMYCADPVDGDIIITNPNHWLFNGTGLSEGSRLKGLLGYEVDSIHSSSPRNIEVLAESPWHKINNKNEHGIAHMTLYKATGGALVFAAGTIQWSWGLDNFNESLMNGSRLNPPAQQMTRNILQRFNQNSQPSSKLVSFIRTSN